MSLDAWLDQSRDDCKAAKVLLVAGHYSQAVWFASQSVEKAQKALFYALGLRITDKQMKRYSHDLGPVAAELPSEFGSVAAQQLVQIDGLTEVCRYPALVKDTVVAPCNRQELGRSVAEDVVATAEDVLKWAETRADWARTARDAIKQAAAAEQVNAKS